MVVIVIFLLDYIKKDRRVDQYHDGLIIIFENIPIYEN